MYERKHTLVMLIVATLLLAVGGGCGSNGDNNSEVAVSSVVNVVTTAVTTATMRLANVSTKSKDEMTSLLSKSRGLPARFLKNRNEGEKRLDAALIKAAGAGDVGAVKRLLAAGAYVDAGADEELVGFNANGDLGYTALGNASMFGHINVVKALIAASADVDAHFGFMARATALRYAAERGHIEIVRLLLSAGADPSPSGAAGYDKSVRRCAAERNQTAVVNLLRSASELSELHIAAETGRITDVRRLLAAGANVNAKDKGGYTPLHLATWAEQSEVVKVLLAAGADVFACTYHSVHGGYICSGWLPIAFAQVGGEWRTQNRAAVEEIARLLEEAAKNATTRTPHDATVADPRRLEAVRKRLVLGRDIMYEFSDACSQGYVYVAKMLIAEGADLNAKIMGRTALFNAVQRGHIEVVRTLVDAGADIYTTDELHSDPAFRTTFTAFHEAASLGYVEIVKIFLTQGIDVDIKTEKGGFSALYLSAQRGHLETVKLLLAKGANANTKTDIGYTALIASARRLSDTTFDNPALLGKENTEVVKLLLAHGADVNVAYGDGWTALMFAALNGCNTIVKMLLDKGADVNAKFENSKTALLFAAEKGHDEVVKILLSAGADDTGLEASLEKRKPPVPPVMTQGTAEYYFERGVAQFSKGFYRNAVDEFGKAIELNPRYAEAYFWRANAYHKRDELDAALRDYEKAIELDPQQKYVNARNAVLKEINPTESANFYYNRGRERFRNGNDDGARQDAQKAAELDPTNHGHRPRGLEDAIKRRDEQR